VNVFIASIEGELATLTPEESWHCARVLRHKAGDAVKLIDGKGGFYDAALTLVSEKKCQAAVVSGPVLQTKRKYYLHLAIAPTKQIDRIEWMVEKAVEIGIDEISFIQCKNSERLVVKHERMVKIVESAVKQSLQACIPVVNELTAFKQFVSQARTGQSFIAHCGKMEKMNIGSVVFGNLSSLVLVGPEGDFTKEEINEALRHNFKAIHLGENRLRTETAGLYVCMAAALSGK
jgi:16S rRNA (uracil1498-N3)-methyltransferase